MSIVSIQHWCDLFTPGSCCTVGSPRHRQHHRERGALAHRAVHRGARHMFRTISSVSLTCCLKSLYSCLTLLCLCLALLHDCLMFLCLCLTLLCLCLTLLCLCLALLCDCLTLLYLCLKSLYECLSSSNVQVTRICSMRWSYFAIGSTTVNVVPSPTVLFTEMRPS
jgi:hypothetical protein